MSSHNNKRHSVLCSLGLYALCALSLCVLNLSARPAEAAPFAYVANSGSGNNPSNTVTVIDIPTNDVVATVTVGSRPADVAVTPDGKHVYVVNSGDNTASVIDAITNEVVDSPIPVGRNSISVAITPDGTRAYVANFGDGTVSVIDTVTNEVNTVPSGTSCPYDIAITPDGERAYVPDECSFTVSVIDITTNEVVDTVKGLFTPLKVAITPDGKEVWVTDEQSHDFRVAVIDTATNSITATLPLSEVLRPFGIAITPDGSKAIVTGVTGFGTATRTEGVLVIDTASKMVVATVPLTLSLGRNDVAITPDGKEAYVTDLGAGTVSVIDITKAKLVATVTAGAFPIAVGIVPPPPGIPFSAFKAKLAIQFGDEPNTDAFELVSEFKLGHKSNGINPPDEPVTLTVGTFTATIPAGSFKGSGYGPFHFVGSVDGVDLEIGIVPTGAKRYAFAAAAQGADLTGTASPVYVTLTIGDDSGVTSSDERLALR